MNRYAYQTTGLAVKALSELSKADIFINGQENIPKGSLIFAINHFTRIETILLPYHIYKLTGIPVWSLADYSLFQGAVGNFLDKMGAVSTKDPDRDLLIVKTLITGEASWVIFPEGRMVKSKKIYEKRKKKGRFIVAYEGGKHRPHTGVATLALRTEFYRQRIKRMLLKKTDEAKRIIDLYQIESPEELLERETYIVPVNITYYPIRTRENILSTLAAKLVADLPDRFFEEIMTEGTMLLSGVDADIRFGEPIKISQYMKSALIRKDIETTDPINFDDPISSRKMLQTCAYNIMQRYMSSIYNLTTVNHDHLMATLLKHIPSNTIQKDDFRKRAYLATTLNLDKLTFYRHRSFSKNQINLLSDDRFHKIDNFLSIVIEKGMVKEKGELLIKDPKFATTHDFHRTRIENPISVIANEIEPLTELQEKLQDLAKKPVLRINYMLSKYLQQKAEYQFEKDYLKYFTEGESKPKDVGRPFLLKGENKELGIVLIHGYMAAPMEVKELARFLNRRGYWVYVPRLKGHGTSPLDLANRTYMEWVETVEEAYAMLMGICRRVVVGGFSTGAGLALDLETRVKNTAGIFAVSPPFQLQDFSSRFVPAVDIWNRLMKRVKLDSIQKEFVYNNPENPHINYFKNPIAGIRELERLMDAVEPKLGQIKVPVLIIQSQRDTVVNPHGSQKVFEMLGSEKKEYLLVNYERHGILLGDGASRIFDAVAYFIEKAI